MFLFKKIESALSKRGMNQTDLALKIGVTRSDISVALKKLRKGESLTTAKLFKIFDALGIDFEFLDK